VHKRFVIVDKCEGVFLEQAEPQPERGQVLCKPISVGLCGTDGLIFSGRMPAVEYPRIPCHEVSALVVSDNSDMSLDDGTAVCINPYISCGKCHACRLGRFNCCKFNQTLGVQRDGVLRERFVVDADRVHVVPAQVNPGLFCLAEPLALALHIVQRAGDINGRWCLVAGAGNVGKLVISILRTTGAKTIAWDISQQRLNEAESIGAQVSVNAAEPTAERQVFDVTDGEGVSVAFDTSGQSKSLEDCIRLAAFAGRVVVVSHSKQISNILGSDLVFKELEVVGSRNSLDKFPKAVEMLAAEPQYWQKLISHRFSFSDALEAFRLMQKNSVPHSKIVIDFPD